MDILRFRKLGVLGHKPSRLNYEHNLEGPCCDFVKSQVKSKLLEGNYHYLVTDMNLGTGMLAVSAAIECDVEVAAMLPYMGWDDYWKREMKQMHRDLREHPKVTYMYLFKDFYAKIFSAVKKRVVMKSDSMLFIFDQEGKVPTEIGICKEMDKPFEIVNPNHWARYDIY